VVIAGAKVHLGPVIAALAEIDKQSDRACMWALREAGRQTKRSARKKVRVKSGLLQASLGSGKLTTVSPRNYRISVRPQGPKAFFYAGKIEKLDGYMAQAHDEISPKFPDIATKAMDRVIAKYGN
jgi:hypothetical protein